MSRLFQNGSQTDRSGLRKDKARHSSGLLSLRFGYAKTVVYLFLISLNPILPSDDLVENYSAWAQQTAVESRTGAESTLPSDARRPTVEGKENQAQAETEEPTSESADPAPILVEPDQKPYMDLDQHVRDFSKDDKDTVPLPSTGETTWDRYHDALSKRILNSAEWIDSFFDDERVEAEENRTNIKLRFDTDLEEGEGVSFRFRVRFRLALPKIERRLSLVISGDPDEDLYDGTPADSIGGNLIESQQEQNITAAFWYSFIDTYKRNLSMRFGAQWRDGGPVLWAGPRYRQLWTFDPWAARYTWSVRWFTDVGFESIMRLDLERPVTRTLFFRQTTTYNWDQENDVTFKLEDGSTEDRTVNSFNQIGLSVSIYQPLNRLSIIEYSTGVSFVDKPERVLDNVSFLVKYRRQIWRDWLFFQVVPALNFPWIDDYEITPSILFRIEMIFGKYK